MRSPLRFCVSSDDSDAAAAEHGPRPGRRVVGQKTLHLMRHGQGVHNQYIEECNAEGRVAAAKLHEAESYPHLVDPVLTAQGEAEAVAARTHTAALCPELLVVSPLRRATDTCRLAFQKQVAISSCLELSQTMPNYLKLSCRQWQSDIPKVAHELCREGYGSGNIYGAPADIPYRSAHRRCRSLTHI
eukprot:SAG31_NODE_4093_length_3598_cov_1.740211_2_plen_187_part_00